MAESDASAGVHMAAHAAMASGLKPVPFELGPLEPLARVRLFPQRVPRPLNISELHCKPCGPSDGIVQPPQRPVDFLRLAEAPLFESLGGNPAQLVNAAARLGLLPANLQANLEPPLPRSFSADASAGPCRNQPGSEFIDSFLGGGPALSTRRRVRLLRPDGRSRDEWLPRAASVMQVLEAHPQGTAR